MNKFDQIREEIGQECIDAGNFTNEQVQRLSTFMNLAKEAYVVVQWPDSQALMEEDWFEKEAILDVDCKFGSSTYFIPLHRLL